MQYMLHKRNWGSVVLSLKKATENVKNQNICFNISLTLSKTSG